MQPYSIVALRFEAASLYEALDRARRTEYYGTGDKARVARLARAARLAQARWYRRSGMHDSAEVVRRDIARFDARAAAAD